MSFSSGVPTITVDDVLEVASEYQITNYYLGITELPCLISSPLRTDIRPSFGVFSPDGKVVRFKDFATGEGGDIFYLLSKLWNAPLNEVYSTIISNFSKVNNSKKTIKNNKLTTTDSKVIIFNNFIKNKDRSEIHVKVRQWRDYDLEYWESYGITLNWLKLADVYPISHKIIKRGSESYTFGVDKYAYAYIERKEGNISIKVYQPFNKNGFKWCTTTDKSVISLWSKIPEYGDKLCICSSLKDALCLWSNTNIPAISLQGEGYGMSQTAIKELKRRYKQIFILFDNDPPGKLDAAKLVKLTNFTNIVLPEFEGGKDISDLYHSLNNKQEFNNIIIPLFNN